MNTMSRFFSKESPVCSSVVEAAKYERFIDGLRAIAVCAVIFFHLFPAVLRGGFVGVDVFFVISGYLITGQIRYQVAAGTFSIGSFYARRIRRIMPVLITVLLGSAIAAMAILKPEDMSSYAKSLLAQSLSLQNFVFLAEGEYFRGADTKPLLHTWSLAIEEQFYLLWPLLLLVIKRARQTSIMALILVLITCSFAVNNFLLSLSPKASFFLLPSRAWELAIGGLAAILHEDRRAGWCLTKPIAAATSMTGVMLILFSIFWIDSTMPFPGNVCLLPVLGSFLVILYGGKGWLVRQVLTSRPMVAIGLISYPLYLWHWPVLTYMHHLGLSTHTFFGVLLFAVVTFGLSVLSHRWIETPIRQRRYLSSTSKLCVVAGTGIVVLGLFALHVMQTQGALYRFNLQSRPFLSASFDAQDRRCGFVFRVLHPDTEVCELVSPSSYNRRVLLWGNSHADMWSVALTETARMHGAALWLNAKNCRGIADSSVCNEEVQDRIVEELRARKATDVVLASSWHKSYDIPDDHFEAELRKQVDRIANLGVRVWLVVDIPVAPQFDPAVAYKQNPAHPSVGTLPTSSYDEQYGREMILFNSIKDAHPQLVRIIDVRSVFCDDMTCISGRDGQVWYRDNNHLTNTGARVGVHVFDPVFTSLGSTTSMQATD
jgi:peptidoglycan/LPS O-acetylase OafA/YrhL